MGNIVVCMYRMINKSLDQGCRGINRLSVKLLNHTTVKEIVMKMVIGFIRLIFFNEFRERLTLL
jgi:hypothetical protein